MAAEASRKARAREERSMKRVLVATSAMVASLFSFDAQAVELGTPAREHPFRTAQNFALELRVSPYRPQVDQDPSLNGTPFASNFGSSPRVYVGLELDWQTLRIPYVGTLGPGLGVGYLTMSRPVQTLSGRTSGDQTNLSIYPFYAVAVLRADTFWRDLGFPLVPYGKAGLAMALWRASNTGGTSSANNVSGKGHSFGTDLAVGVMLALDALDPGASRNMDNATGINNTYLYIEAYWLSLNGLAQTNALHVGTSSWAAGLAFEF
jgi:hypothetical protein